MADDGYGPKSPLGIDAACAELAGCPAPWWISGGHALDLFAGRSWRAHDDLDIGIRRIDAVAVLGHLRSRGWEAQVAAGGVLAPWDGGGLSAAASHNNVWCRRPGGPWQIDVTVGDGDDARWIYRRDPAITRPWPEALCERDGVRYLAPALQLLFKGKSPRPKDTVDAHEVVPLLARTGGGGGLALLAVQLPAGHPWRDLVQAHAPACTASDVGYVLDRLAAAGIAAWVDGGWAVDALLGEVTRPHADLDLALARPAFDRALAVLAAHGFRVVRDDGPHNRVLADAAGRRVDLHAFDPTVVQASPDGIARHGGDGLAYEAGGFGGRGTIGGRAVDCIAPATLVRYHTGYAVDADDWHDVRRLCARFGLPVPADYARFGAAGGHP